MTFGGSMARSTKNGGRQVAKTSDMLGDKHETQRCACAAAMATAAQKREGEEHPRSPLKTTGKVTGTFTSLILWIY